MEKGRRRNRAKAKQRSDRAAVPASVDDLPDELLDRVLLGLDSPLDLIRAAATCRRWRRAVAADGFLGRFHALHGAPRVAGHYYVTDTLDPNSSGRWRWPSESPAAFVPTSPAVVDGRLFSLDFLHVPPAEADHRPRRCVSYRSAGIIRHSRSREIIDSRGSLLLLTNAPRWRCIDLWYWSPDFIVCEPVTRRFQGITRPSDLGHLPFLGAFLLDGGGSGTGGGDAMSSYRLLSVLYERNPYGFQFGGPRPRRSGKPRACVFSPGSDGGSAMCWDDGGYGVVDIPSSVEMIHLAGRAAGRIFWGTEAGDVLVLDEATLKLSLLTFPAPMRWAYRRTSFRVIGGSVDGGDTVRVVRMVGDDLEVFGRLPGSDQWVMEIRVPLGEVTAGLPGWDRRFFSQPARIVTAGSSVVVLTPAENTWLFSVDLETMEVESEHERNRHVGPSNPCTLPWPPVLQACVDHGGIVGKRRQRCKG